MDHTETNVNLCEYMLHFKKQQQKQKQSKRKTQTTKQKLLTDPLALDRDVPFRAEHFEVKAVSATQNNGQTPSVGDIVLPSVSGEQMAVLSSS